MNTAIELLNEWGGRLPGLAWAMFWQSSALVLVILALDFALRRRLRASVRYGLWLVLLVKLVLPPSLALPTSPVWWWHPATPVAAPVQPVAYPETTVVYDNFAPVDSTRALPPAPEVIPPPTLNPAARVLLAIAVVSAGLLLWLLVRWGQVIRTGRVAVEEPAFAPLLRETCELAAIRPRVRVKITRQTMSPAVCGLFRPVILLPQSLTDTLSPEQLRAVLLHELMHLRRGDVWVNFAQALLQIVYWWHPLVWLANARIRRVREEAVDDAVVVALREDAEIYAPTLLAVAKFAFQRPLASLGLVGILESRSALRQRIERLVNLPVPRRAGLTVLSALGLLAFSAMAVPMGQGPAAAPGDSPTPVGVIADGHTPLDAPPPDPSDLPPATARVFQLTPDGLAAFRKATGLDAHSPANDYLREFSGQLNFKSTAPPTTGLWISDPALLVVRGPAPELDAVEKLVASYNGQLHGTAGFKLVGTGHPTAFPDGGNNSIEIPPRSSKDTNLFTRTFRLNTNVFFTSLRRALDRNPTFSLRLAVDRDTTSSADDAKLIRELFQRFQIDFEPPKSVFYNDRHRLLFVKATAADLDVIEQVIEALEQTPPGSAADDDWRNIQDAKLLFEQGKLDDAESKFFDELIAHPDDKTAQYYLDLIRQARLATAKTIYTGGGRHDIVLKLSGIMLDRVSYHGPLSEVVSNLSAQIRELDPEKKGVNFLINPNAAPGATIDPATGQPVTASAADGPDINSAMIQLEVQNVTAEQVLDAIVMVSDQPIKYSLQDFGVVFYPQPMGVPAYTRTFKVDPDTFVQGLESVGSTTFGASAAGGGASAGGSSGNNSGAVIPVVNVAPGAEQLRGGSGGGGAGAQSQSVKPFGGQPTASDLNTRLLDFMDRLGVDVTPPNAIFFNRQKGTLLVKASRADLKKIEIALAAMKSAPPQSRNDSSNAESGNISVATSSANPTRDENPPETQQPSDRTLGFDWYLGQFSASQSSGAPNASPTVGTITNVLTDPKYLGQFATSRSGGTTNAGPVVETTAGILADPQFRKAIRALEKRQGIENVAAPEVTTTSGREENISSIFTLAGLSVPPAMNTVPADHQTQSTPVYVAQNSIGGSSQGSTVGFSAGNSTQPAAHFSDTYFRVNPTNFLAVVAATLGTNPPAGPPDGLLVNYFRYIGVEWTAQDSVSYTASNGIVYVRALRPDLKRIQDGFAALKVLEWFPQFHLKSYFIEVGGAITNVDEALQGALIASYIDTNKNVEIGIMSSTQARSFRHKLQGFPEAVTLAELEVTLSNHRHIKMKSTEMKTIVFGLRPDMTNAAADSIPYSNDPMDRLVTTNYEFGPIFEAIPTVMGDGFTAELKARATLAEFDGYEPSAKSTQLQPVVPVFTVREMNANLRLYDSQALIMIDRQPRRAPADTARANTYSESPVRPGKAETLLIVITYVSLVDAAGNLIHSDKEMPFAADHIPPQEFGPTPGPYLDDRPFDNRMPGRF